MPNEFYATDEIQSEWGKDPNITLPGPVLHALECVPLAAYPWHEETTPYHVVESSPEYKAHMEAIHRM